MLTGTVVLHAADRYVSAKGSDAAAGEAATPWQTIQYACDHARPGDTIHVTAGTYHEKLLIKVSGTAGAFITVKGQPGTILNGKGVKGDNMILIENQSYLKVTGFEITDHLDVKDGSGIRVTGHGSHIELRDNRIHKIRGRDAMGITIYGTDVSAALEHLVIDGNEIYDCDPARSEALTLNGNISQFQVTNNVVHDVNNIGIDFIGGEAWTSGDSSKVARNGLCKGNKVYRCRATYEDGYAAGIYVDGGRNIVLEDNIVTQCDLGIEIGAENKGSVASGIVVRNNVMFLNDKAGLVFGGYEKSAGRVQKCTFTGNICYRNNRHKEDHNGELWIQWSSDNQVTGNTFVVDGSDSPLTQVVAGGDGGNHVEGNRYYTDAGAEDAFFLWKDGDVNGFADWQQTSGMDRTSVFGPVNLKLPAIEP